VAQTVVTSFSPASDACYVLDIATRRVAVRLATLRRRQRAASETLLM
jgi:hypothetical protein